MSLSWLKILSDSGLWQTTWLTLRVSLSATILAMLLGIPLGTWLADARFRGRNFIVSLFNAGMGLPPVIAGLAVVFLLWRRGPFGSLGLLYTPAAMIAAQVIIAFPIITALTIAAMQQLDAKMKTQTLSLGASRFQGYLTHWREAGLPLLAAVMAGFGGVISEVGAVLMTGGNIKGDTRVLTTAIVLETRMGRFNRALALAVILLILIFTVNLLMTYIQQRRD